MATEQRRAILAVTVAVVYALALGVLAWVLSGVAPITGPDAGGWLTVLMIVGAAAGFLAVVLRLSVRQRATTALVLPALGAGAGFLLAGGVLFGLGGGDPLRGPIFSLAQFGFPGIYLVLVLGILAALAFRMGTSPHRSAFRRPIG